MQINTQQMMADTHAQAEKSPARADLSSLRVAVVHDFLYTYAGAEKVLEQILHIFPQADLFSLFDFLPESQRGFIGNRVTHTSFLQRMPFARKKHRMYLPLMPLAIEQLDVSGYDIVISSSYVAAKGVLTGPDQLHICYCHSPVRFAWDLQHQYLSESGLRRGLGSVLARIMLHYIRMWDVRSANGVDIFVTNSHFVSRRVAKAYRRNSRPIYPPVNVEQFTLQNDKENFFLTASRMVPYKRMDLIVQAFSKMPERKLVVIGDGPEFAKIQKLAGPNVQLLGYQPFSVLRDHMQRAKGFVFAAEEDFGITPVEAQACGTPVIAYGRGGVCESVIDSQTGLFFKQQSVDEVCKAVADFESRHWDAAAIRAHAEKFSTQRFRDEFYHLVEENWSLWHSGL